MKNKNKKAKNSKFWNYMLLIYIVFIFIFVVLKFSGSISEITERIIRIQQNKDMGYPNINLVPFRTISLYMNNISSPYAYLNIVGNIVIFVPLGFLLPIVFVNLKSIIKVSLCCLVFILFIETFQYVYLLGYFDIDDLILNMFGCILGYIVFCLCRMVKIFK